MKGGGETACNGRSRARAIAKLAFSGCDKHSFFPTTRLHQGHHRSQWRKLKSKTRFLWKLWKKRVVGEAETTNSANKRWDYGGYGIWPAFLQFRRSEAIDRIKTSKRDRS